MNLHLGSGPHHIDGWINIDNQAYPAREGVPDNLALGSARGDSFSLSL